MANGEWCSRLYDVGTAVQLLLPGGREAAAAAAASAAALQSMSSAVYLNHLESVL